MTKPVLASPAIVALHKSTITDKDVVVSCAFSGKGINILSNSDFGEDLTVFLIFMIKQYLI